MAEHTISIAEAQEQLMQLPERLEQEPGVFIVTRRDQPVLAILPFKAYREMRETIESLIETLEILRDKETMAAFRQGVREMEEGKGKSWDEVKKELGWEDAEADE